MRAQQTESLETVVALREFERLPEEDEYGIELVRGRVVREPRPGGEHGWLTAKLTHELYSHVLERGLGLVVTDAGFLLTDDPPTVRGPDAAFIASGRIPADGIPTGFWRLPPDLAVEVVSPSNTAAEIQEKVLDYLRAGTRLIWVVDPRTRSVTAYRSRSDVRLLTEGDALEGSDVLPDFELAVAELFRRPPGSHRA